MARVRSLLELTLKNPDSAQRPPRTWTLFPASVLLLWSVPATGKRNVRMAGGQAFNFIAEQPGRDFPGEHLRREDPKSGHWPGPAQPLPVPNKNGTLAGP
jgi:hypothetical protein